MVSSKRLRIIALKRLISIVILCLLVYSGFHYLTALGRGTELSEVKSNTSNTIIGDKSSNESESYVLIDLHTSKVLKADRPDVQRAPASTTKLLTGLIALKTLKETDIVKVGNEVTVDGSRLGLSPGDVISVHDLLTALYVHSANDAAAAIAVKISGSIPAFAEEMNNYAVTLGCQHSHFTNPHGMPDSDHYTTANDLSKIASLFIKNEVLMNYVKEPRARVQWKDTRGVNHYAEVQTTNKLLGVYPGDEGLKTGTTTEAGECLVSYVTRPDGDLLLVVLGSKQRYNDTIKLLDEGWAMRRSNAALRGLAESPRSLISGPGLY
ncbi:MAG: D-alanyl-D-alanine carboxypeptidase [Bacillota bacterium]|nr:D-alanyl-D-alanine carboxypeptidase [Bacillota bacterium]